VTSAVLRDVHGRVVALDTARWHARATPEEDDVLADVRGPVIDLGCGPGRIVVTLASRRVPALGVDASPTAAALARSNGAAVLERDLFDRLPGEGRWATVLLFDGNIGIGGDPARLLARCRRLLASDGRVIAEVDPPGTGIEVLRARVEAAGRRSPPFPWALVGVEAIGAAAEEARLAVEAVHRTPSGRYFAHLAGARP
jgi:SAM-dependent methyltransferase